MAERADGVKREEAVRVMHEVAERASRILQEFGQKQLQSTLASAVKDELGIARAYMDLWSRTLMDPSALAAASINYWVDSMRLWQSSWLKMMGQGAQMSFTDTTAQRTHNPLDSFSQAVLSEKQEAR